jgi:hypothetical protein
MINTDNPLYISVDLEFTDGQRFLEGRIMQIGAVAKVHALDREFACNMPVSTRAYANPWVKENLGELLRKCWLLDNVAAEAEAPFYETRTGKVSRLFRKNMVVFQQWVRKMQLARHKAALHEEVPLGMGPADLGNYLDEKVPAVMVTYCGGYDFAFLAKAFSACGLSNPFHYEMLDISPLAMGKLGLPWGFWASELEEKLGIEPNENKHDALADAKHQLKLFETLMDPELLDIVFDAAQARAEKA